MLFLLDINIFSFRFAFQYISFRCVALRNISLRFVAFRNISFRFVSLRFDFVSYFSTTHFTDLPLQGVDRDEKIGSITWKIILVFLWNFLFSRFMQIMQIRHILINLSLFL